MKPKDVDIRIASNANIGTTVTAILWTWVRANIEVFPPDIGRRVRRAAIRMHAHE